MTWSVLQSDKARHLVLRAFSGETLPDALSAMLRDAQVAGGWLRASGVLADVELRAFDAELGTLGSTRRITGPVQVLALEGSVGLVAGEPSFAMRALLARETDRGLETLAGEIASARAVALEVFVTVLDDVVLERSLDETAGVWLLRGAADGAPAGVAPRLVASPAASPVRASAPAAPAAPTAWSAALEASDDADRSPPPPRARPASGASAPHVYSSSTAVPQRPPRPPAADFDTPYPEPGDLVDHFAFGRAEVLKSDGDRLHLKVHKDGRIREIALQMLKVARLEDTDEGRRRFKLERRM